MTQLTPHEEDPIVHGLLANLKQHSPSPGFADKVMRSVSLPKPQLAPREEDPFVHGVLESLEQFAPSAGFADRVMQNVYQPTPGWVQTAARVLSSAFDSKRAWAVVGGLAATSTVATIALTFLAITYWVQVETAFSVAWGTTADIWRFAVHAAAGFTVFAMRLIEPLQIGKSTLATLAVSSGIVFGLSSIGLQRTIRLYRNERMLLHADK